MDDQKVLNLEKCTICLESFKCNNHIKNLDCSHRFHRICFSKFINNNDTIDILCPLCRKNIDGRIIIETRLNQLEYYRLKYSKLNEKIKLYNEKKKELFKEIFPNINCQETLYKQYDDICSSIYDCKDKIANVLENNSTLSYDFSNEIDLFE